MGSTVGARVATGQVIATNLLINVTTVGFVPSVVTVENQTNQVRGDWNDKMADAYITKTVAAGTRSTVTSAGITPITGVNPGFSIGAALADINDTAGEVLTWIAIE